jgi:hypothetical protein
MNYRTGWLWLFPAGLIVAGVLSQAEALAALGISLVAGLSLSGSV